MSMSNTIIRIIVKKNESDARIVEQELLLKEFQTTLSKTKNVVWDSTDFGRPHDILNDLDDEMFVVIGIK